MSSMHLKRWKRKFIIETRNLEIKTRNTETTTPRVSSIVVSLIQKLLQSSKSRCKNSIQTRKLNQRSLRLSKSKRK